MFKKNKKKNTAVFSVHSEGLSDPGNDWKYMKEHTTSLVLHEIDYSYECCSLHTSTWKHTHPTPRSLLTDFSTQGKSHAHTAAGCVWVYPRNLWKQLNRFIFSFFPNSFFLSFFTFLFLSLAVSVQPRRTARCANHSRWADTPTASSVSCRCCVHLFICRKCTKD